MATEGSTVASVVATGEAGGLVSAVLLLGAGTVLQHDTDPPASNNSRPEEQSSVVTLV